MLTSWAQDAPSAVKIAWNVTNQIGFELCRLLWRDYLPGQKSKALMWRRALLNPKFPTQEIELSAGRPPEMGVGDVDKYAVDRDNKALLVPECPPSLRQRLQAKGASARRPGAGSDRRLHV